EADQLLIGHGAPQKVAKTRREFQIGDGVVLTRLGAGRFLFKSEDKFRLREDRLDRSANAALKATVIMPLLVITHQALEILGARGSPECLACNTGDDLLRACIFLNRRGRPTGKDAVSDRAIRN